MNELSDLFKLVAEAKKTDPVAIKTKEIKENIKEDLGSIFGEIASIKQQDPAVQKSKQIKQHIQEVVKDDLGSLFSELAALKKPKELEVEIVEEVQPIVEEVLVEIAPVIEQPPTVPEIDKYLTGKSFQQPDPDKVDPNIKAIQDKLKFMEQAIGRIAAHGPGSGEVNLRYLDDIDRPTIYDMRFLRYNATSKKFEFAEVNPHDIVYTTHLVTTATYTVDSDDYYVGVNYAGPVTITLPTTLVSSGRSIVIKDESGAAETNPITVLGTVDNDAGGFIIQINNGAIQLLYRNGWRIV
jgi:hypothetical protein